jgi:hypothetical protein
MFQEIIEIDFTVYCWNSLYVVCNRFKLDFVDYIVNSVQINLNIDYFTNNYQNGALSIYATIALFFLVSMFATLSNRPQILHTSFKKIAFFSLLGQQFL